MHSKPGAVVSASLGGIGGFGANHHLRQSLVFLNVPAMAQPEAYIGSRWASMHVHHRWAQAMTLIQIAIALAAITILTRNRRLQYLAYGGAAAAVAIGALAFAHI